MSDGLQAHRSLRLLVNPTITVPYASRGLPKLIASQSSRRAPNDIQARTWQWQNSCRPQILSSKNVCDSTESFSTPSASSEQFARYIVDLSPDSLRSMTPSFSPNEMTIHEEQVPTLVDSNYFKKWIYIPSGRLKCTLTNISLYIERRKDFSSQQNSGMCYHVWDKY